MFAVDTDHATILQLSALHVAGQPICDRVTFCFGTARTKVRGHAKSSFGPEMGGRDPVLHAGLSGALMGGPEALRPSVVVRDPKSQGRLTLSQEY